MAWPSARVGVEWKRDSVCRIKEEMNKLHEFVKNIKLKTTKRGIRQRYKTFLYSFDIVIPFGIWKVVPISCLTAKTEFFLFKQVERSASALAKQIQPLVKNIGNNKTATEKQLEILKKEQKRLETKLRRL